MMTKFLSWLEEKLRTRSKAPWARFTTAGIEDGSVRYDMAWNPAFLANLRSAGFVGHSEQEIVENFFLGSMIIPKADGLNEEVSDDSLAAPSPSLASDRNRFKS